MSRVVVYLPVMVDFKRKKQKLRFLLQKTAAQTVAAIMKRLKCKEDPSRWGLYRLSRQHWLKPNQILSELDIIILETLVLCPRQDFLGAKIKARGLGPEMRADEQRIVRILTSLGTKKVIKYDFNMTPDQIIENINKKDPIPDIQNYALFYEDLNTYLQHDQPISVYQLPDNAEVKMRKMRVRFNVRIRNPDTVAEFNLCMPVKTTVPDAIEYIFSQLDAKAAAGIKTDKDRAKLVRTYGLYVASDQNEHGLVMTPNRTIESYRLKPNDEIVFKRRPKDQAELLLTSHDKLKQEAASNTFVRIVSVNTDAQSTFKFPSGVTVQQATSKASKKFDLFGAYGLRLPKGGKVKKPMFLEPTRLISQYGLESMCTLEFVERPGAKPTTPNDDIGAANTTRAVPVDTTSRVVQNSTLSPHQAAAMSSPAAPRRAPPPAAGGGMPAFPNLPPPGDSGTMSLPPPVSQFPPPGPQYPPARGTGGLADAIRGTTMRGPPPVATRPTFNQPPGNQYGAPSPSVGNQYGAPSPNQYGAPSPSVGNQYGAPSPSASTLPPPVSGLPPTIRNPSPGMPPPVAAPTAAPSDLDVLDDLLGDVDGIDTSQILHNAPAAEPAFDGYTGEDTYDDIDDLPVYNSLPPAGTFGAPPPMNTGLPPPMHTGLPPPTATQSLPPPAAYQPPPAATPQYQALDAAPAAAAPAADDGMGDEWDNIDAMLDFDDMDF